MSPSAPRPWGNFCLHLLLPTGHETLAAMRSQDKVALDGCATSLVTRDTQLTDDGHILSLNILQKFRSNHGQENVQLQAARGRLLIP